MMMIEILCSNCGTTHEVTKDKEAPKNAVSMGCNWCPECEGEIDEYYKEWYNFPKNMVFKLKQDPNQLKLFSNNLS